MCPPMATPRRTPVSPARGVFVKTRTDHAHETFEDYVEAIDAMLSAHGSCRVRDLAAHMRVSHVTVVRIVQRLTLAGLARKQRHGPISLSASGERLARASRARHATVVSFLMSLGVRPAEAARDSEGIEHHCGASTLAAMRRFLALNGRSARARDQDARRPARPARVPASRRRAPS